MKEEDKAVKRKKKRKKKKRRKKHLLLKFLLLVALGVGLYYFLNSELFDIQKIQVDNISHYTADQIVELSKLKKGQNIFFDISLSDSAKDLLTDPYMKDVSVKRKLPATVVITVTERVEYAAVPYGTEYILIDEDAIVLSRTNTAPELPLLMGMTVKVIEPGKLLEVEENNVLEETMKLLAAMEEGDLYFKKIEISDVLIKAYIYDYLICEGTPENILKGMDNIRRVIYEMYGRGIERGVIRVNDSNQWAWSPLIE